MPKLKMKDIKGFEGKYAITEDGRVYSYLSNRFLEAHISNGYYEVQLYNNGIRTHKRIHRLVAETFIPNPDNLPVVNHKDENKLNNDVDNLEWCTQQYNIMYGEGRKKHTEKVKGKPIPKLYKKVAKCDIETKEIIKEYDSLKQAGEENNINYTNISSVCNGKRKSTGGYYWQFIDN